MKNRRPASLALLAALYGACSPLSTDPADKLDLAIAVEPMAARIGESLLVVLTLQNRTANTVTLTTAQCLTGFEVYDSTGARVFWFACPRDVARMTTLRGGEEIVQAFPWVAGTRSGSASPLAPGTYTIRGVLDPRNPAQATTTVTVILAPN